MASRHKQRPGDVWLRAIISFVVFAVVLMAAYRTAFRDDIELEISADPPRVRFSAERDAADEPAQGGRNELDTIE